MESMMVQECPWDVLVRGLMSDFTARVDIRSHNRLAPAATSTASRLCMQSQIRNCHLVIELDIKSA